MTEKEVEQVFEFVTSQDKGIFTFMRTYGARPSEASGLLRSKVNWETQSIVIDAVYVVGRMKPRTKTHRTRELPIVPEVLPYLATQGNSVFVFHVEGRPYSIRMLQDRWDQANKKANEKYGTRIVSVSKLRHSWATQRRKQGFTLEQIKAVLGHSDIRVTEQHYAAIGAGDLVEIVRGK